MYRTVPTMSPALVSSSLSSALARPKSVTQTAPWGLGRAGPAQALQLVEHAVQALALDELHGVVVGALALADAEDRHDVRVVQPGHRPRLAAEALQVGGGPPALRRQHLQGDVPAER